MPRLTEFGIINDYHEALAGRDLGSLASGRMGNGGVLLRGRVRPVRLQANAPGAGRPARQQLDDDSHDCAKTGQGTTKTEREPEDTEKAEGASKRKEYLREM